MPSLSMGSAVDWNEQAFGPDDEMHIVSRPIWTRMRGFVAPNQADDPIVVDRPEVVPRPKPRSKRGYHNASPTPAPKYSKRPRRPRKACRISKGRRTTFVPIIEDGQYRGHSRRSREGDPTVVCLCTVVHHPRRCPKCQSVRLSPEMDTSSPSSHSAICRSPETLAPRAEDAISTPCESLLWPEVSEPLEVPAAPRLPRLATPELPPIRQRFFPDLA